MRRKHFYYHLLFALKHQQKKYKEKNCHFIYHSRVASPFQNNRESENVQVAIKKSHTKEDEDGIVLNRTLIAINFPFYIQISIRALIFHSFHTVFGDCT
jgi:hypothetical protein